MSSNDIITLVVTDRQGETHNIDSQSGHDNIMQVLFDAGQEIEAVCGGCCACATCHVYIDPEWMPNFPDRDENESVLLEYTEHFDVSRSRLSCQLKLSEALDGIQLELAPED